MRRGPDATVFAQPMRLLWYRFNHWLRHSPLVLLVGLLLGGLLALFSHRWLSNSAAAAVPLSATGGRSQWKLAQFVLRYVVIAAAVFAAYTLDLVSLTAVLAGMCSFVVAIFVEAIREFYFAIIKREEN